MRFVLEYTADDLKKAEIAVKEKRDVVVKDRRIVESAVVRFEKANGTYFEAEN